MTGNNNKVVQIFSINVESDQDYQRYTSRRKSSVIREISGRIHSVLNREEEDDVDVSVDGVFRFNGQIDVNNVIPTSSQPSVEAQHFQRRGSSLTNGYIHLIVIQFYQFVILLFFFFDKRYWVYAYFISGSLTRLSSELAILNSNIKYIWLMNILKRNIH